MFGTFENFILGLVSIALAWLIAVLFMSSLYRRDKYSRRSRLWLVAGVLITRVATALLIPFPFIRVTVNLILIILFMKQYLGISLKQSVIGNTIYTAIVSACEMIAYYSIQQLINLPVYEDINNANGAFFIELLSLMLAFVIVVIVSAFLRRSALARLEPKHWFLLIVFPLLSITSFAFLLINSDKYINAQMSNVYIIISIVEMVLNIALFYFLDRVICLESDEGFLKKYLSAIRTTEIQKSHAHDYVNHLRVIQELGKKGDYDTQQTYIDERIEEALSQLGEEE